MLYDICGMALLKKMWFTSSLMAGFQCMFETHIMYDTKYFFDYDVHSYVDSRHKMPKSNIISCTRCLIYA